MNIRINNPLLRKSKLVVICHAIVLSLVPCCNAIADTTPNLGQQPPKIEKVVLTGKELLIEAVNSEGMLGIYALNILGDKSLRLVVKGATTPRWSVKHQNFLYLKNHVMSVYQINGSETEWSNDRILHRFAMKNSLDMGSIWWDYSGKANFIDYWPSFGRRLNRSINLFDKATGQPPTPSQWGFYDSVVPMKSAGEQKKYFSIGAASISSDEENLVAQVYPALPRDLGAFKSNIRLYKLLYNLSKKDEKEWMIKVRENSKFFYSDGVMSQVDGEGVLIGSPKEGDIDIEPKFSPSGKYIVFNRIDTKSKSVYPLIVDLNNLDKTVDIPIEMLANEQAFYPDRVWGWPHHSAVQWSQSEDILWVTSGLQEKMYAVKKVGDEWKSILVCGLKLNRGSFAHHGFFDNLFCFTYGNQPNRIYYVNSDEGEDNINFVDLPEGLDVRDIDW